jgi:hypothetical protein
MLFVLFIFYFLFVTYLKLSKNIGGLIQKM